jgi:hypothetical protein
LQVADGLSLIVFEKLESLFEGHTFVRLFLFRKLDFMFEDLLLPATEQLHSRQVFHGPLDCLNPSALLDQDATHVELGMLEASLRLGQEVTVFGCFALE